MLFHRYVYQWFQQKLPSQLVHVVQLSVGVLGAGVDTFEKIRERIGSLLEKPTRSNCADPWLGGCLK